MSLSVKTKSTNYSLVENKDLNVVSTNYGSSGQNGITSIEIRKSGRVHRIYLGGTVQPTKTAGVTYTILSDGTLPEDSRPANTGVVVPLFEDGVYRAKAIVNTRGGITFQTETTWSAAHWVAGTACYISG